MNQPMPRNDTRRRISIFGATGSIGCNTVDLVERQGGAETYEVVALTGGRNVALLAEQARRLRAGIAVTAHEECLPELQARLAGSGIETAAGAGAIAEAAARPVDWTMSAIVGAAGIVPGFLSLAHGGVLALANKETLVAAGDLVREKAARHGATLLPVDSEHSAIFQALVGEDRRALERIVLTASGGPFRDWPLARMAAVTPEEAVRHPNWSMGVRISIDSASMFNKALEMIEAHVLFDMPPAAIEVVIHPQSVVHSLVGFTDGAMLAHLGPPDMRGAIGYALNWPERRPLPLERLDLAALGRLDFAAPDDVRFPALRLAREVMEIGRGAGAAFNAAKEVALDGFIARRIGFLDMARLVEQVIGQMERAGEFASAPASLDDVLALDAAARARASACIEEMAA